MTPVRSNGYRREPFPFDGKTAEHFELALSDAAMRKHQSLGNLEEATRVCVRELKHDGMTPEGVIITMRAYLRHVMRYRIFVDRLDDFYGCFELLGDRLANWCVDEYFPD